MTRIRSSQKPASVRMAMCKHFGLPLALWPQLLAKYLDDYRPSRSSSSSLSMARRRSNLTLFDACPALILSEVQMKNKFKNLMCDQRSSPFQEIFEIGPCHLSSKLTCLGHLAQHCLNLNLRNETRFQNYLFEIACWPFSGLVSLIVFNLALASWSITFII